MRHLLLRGTLLKDEHVVECLRKMALQLFEVFTGDWAICNFVAVAVTGGAALLALLLLLLLRGEMRQKALRPPPLQANDMKRVRRRCRVAPAKKDVRNWFRLWKTLS